MDHLIRPYQKADYDQVIDLIRVNTPKYFDPIEEEEFAIYLKGFPKSYYVLLKGERVVGAGGFDIKEYHGILSWYFLHPEFQGKGLGSAIVQRNLNELRNTPSIDKVIVRTSQFADSFFSKQGFKLLKIEKDYWAKGYDLHLMERGL